MKVCVVGTGASGLPAIRVCREYGFEVVCLEKSSGIGGIWRYKQQIIHGEGSVMKSTVQNTSKEMTAYSDFPPPSDFANFMHNTQMLRYLEQYAKHHDLLNHIRFNHCVTNVSRAENYNKSGQWTVCYLDESGNEKAERFDGVMLASGRYVDPNSPKPWPGQENYKGEILHSHSYRHHHRFEDKRVIVVGIGNSGADIAVELSYIAAQVYLATRRGAWVISRLWDNGRPLDMVVNKRFISSIRPIFPSRLLNWIFERKLDARFDHTKFGLKPAHRVFGALLTVNDELPYRIACGAVTIKPNIANFTETGVIFEDGSMVDRIDAVIFATGYKLDFPYVEGGQLIPVRDNQVQLYQYMYPTNLAEKNSLAVIGIVQPTGSVMPVAEMQARVFCNVLNGQSILPDEHKMLKSIESKRQKLAELYVLSPRHNFVVDHVQYMDELAKIIGAKPDVWSVLRSDPFFGFKLIFGPNVSYQYRLHGPHPWSGARDAIMRVEDRVDAAMATRICQFANTTPPQLYCRLLIPLVGILIAFYAFYTGSHYFHKL